MENFPEQKPILPFTDDEIKCPQCGMIWKSVMSYSCMNDKCPIQPKAWC